MNVVNIPYERTVTVYYCSNANNSTKKYILGTGEVERQICQRRNLFCLTKEFSKIVKHDLNDKRNT